MACDLIVMEPANNAAKCPPCEELKNMIDKGVPSYACEFALKTLKKYSNRPRDEDGKPCTSTPWPFW